MIRRIACFTLALMVAGPLFAQQRRAGESPLDRGIRQVEEGDFETAIKTLEQALPALSGDRHSQDRSRAYLYMAYAYLYLSQEARAKARFAEALKQNRNLNLSPSEFPPKVIQLFEETRKEEGLPAVAPAPPSPGASANAAVFLLAVRSGDFGAVSQLLKDEPGLVAVRDNEYGATPLHWAAAKGNQVLVAYLLASGADPKAKNKRDQTPLEVAQLAKDQAPRQQKASFDEVIETLRGATEKVFVAAERGDWATVRSMVDKDSSLVRQRDSRYGATLLHWVAAKGDASIASYLLAKGADASMVNNAGQTPLKVGELARDKASSDAERARIDGVISVLAGRRAPVARATSPAPAPAPPPAPPAARSAPASAPAPAAGAGSDALLIAARAGDVDAARRALAADPSLLNRPDPEYGATPLHWAALKGNALMVSFLLGAGADTRALNRAGETPLQVAERANRPEALSLLLEEQKRRTGR